MKLQSESESHVGQQRRVGFEVLFAEMALDEVGWAIGGKTGTGARAGAPLGEQDGWFAGLVFDRGKKPVTQ